IWHRPSPACPQSRPALRRDAALRDDELTWTTSGRTAASRAAVSFVIATRDRRSADAVDRAARDHHGTPHRQQQRSRWSASTWSGIIDSLNSDTLARIVSAVTAEETRMERYIRDENIRRFRQLLEAETDQQKRRILQELLAAEEDRQVPSVPGGPID